jgi:NADH-quinone oxidoreductase subunit N
MQNKMSSGLYSVVLLNSFTVFPEYLISVSILYVLIVMVLVTYNVYGLMIQKALSECIALMLFMACYLMINDDLIALEILTPYGAISDLTLTSNITSFNHSIANDYFGFFTKFVVCFSSAIYFMLIAESLKEQRLTSFEYLLITLFAVLGLMLLCSSNDLLTAYLAIELSSLASYVLASFRKSSNYSVESGLKYFITGAISSAFFLLGSSFIYGFTSSINFTVFATLFGDSTQLDSIALLNIGNDDLINLTQYPTFFDYSFAVEVGLALICFSLFIKLALAPFHLWSLDVYEGSPTSAAFFFAVISKLSIFVLLVRLCFQGYANSSESWQFYSLWVGLFSIFVGCSGGLKQRKLKTLLAYSSTSHMGYSLIAFSTGTYFGIQMMIFALVIYIIAGLCTWSIILLLRLKKKGLGNKYNKELGDLVLLRKSNPSLAFALSITMFSVAGIPPMAGFISKMSLFLPVLNLSHYSLYVAAALISFLLSVISTFYYIRVIKILYFESTLVGRLYYSINTNQTLTLSILVFLLLFIFVNPTLLYLLTYKAKFSLY